jgi:HD-GYP domain-containing protein (c-di-GMP phosphodiesterase class II)
LNPLATASGFFFSDGMQPQLTPPEQPRARPLLVMSADRTIASLPKSRREDDLEMRKVAVLPAAASLDPDRPTVIVLDDAFLACADHEAIEALSRRAALVGIGDSGETMLEGWANDYLIGFVAADARPAIVIATLRGAFNHAVSIVAERKARLEEEERRRELGELTRVGVALSTERDLVVLLEMILSQARRITASDAGSLYLTERDENGVPRSLRFRFAQNHTLPNLPLREFSVPIDHASLAGYAASTAEPLVIADVYLLPNNVSYKQNRSFDERFNYRTKSMLVIPMKTHKDEVIGVLQLINRKRHPDVKLTSPDITEDMVVPYDARSVELVSALASQAAVGIENSRLYEDIEKLFEGFVTAAVTAIESRDPTTSGHSGRVATLTVSLAEAVDRGGEGPYKSVRFSREELRELRYAGLLHDFGKVGVREQVLVKQKKLYPADLELIRNRFAFLMQAADLAFERERAEYLLVHGKDGFAQACHRMNEERMEKRKRLHHFLDTVTRANEPTVLPEGSFEELAALSHEMYTDFDGIQRQLLGDEELKFLMIRRGNLDDRERREIESHVTHTYRFLEQIPWTRELKNIPKIAFGHHEKLNGRGYPRAIGGEEIPVQTRMMTISDIFDALTASDRPYKRAVPLERALDILHAEAKEGMLDDALLRTFVEARVFESLHSTASS